MSALIAVAVGVMTVATPAAAAPPLVGQGEGINDLTGFTPHVFAAQLVA